MNSLYPHQIEGIEWMLNLEHKNKSGILADEPGLGKTYQILSLIEKNRLTLPTLIVVPKCILLQWRDNINNLTYRIHYGLSCITRDTYANFNIILTTYNKLLEIDCILNTLPFGRIVLDECHIIKNSKTKIHKTCLELNAKYKWGLSGTPIHNNKNDIINLLCFTGISRRKVVEKLDKLVETRILRRNKLILSNLFTNLNIIDIELDFDNSKEMDLYLYIKTKIKNEYLKLLDKEHIMTELLELLLRLRQSTIHPNLVIESISNKKKINNPSYYNNSTTKINEIIRLLSNNITNDKYIIICHFTSEMDIIKHYINESLPKLCVAIYNGSLSMYERNTIINDSENIDVLLLQILAGGVGLNLQAYNKIIMVSPDWNPANEIQAIARAHRLGQQRNVVVYNLILNNTIDVGIKNLQIKKRELMAKYLNDTTFLHSKSNNFNLSIREIIRLLK